MKTLMHVLLYFSCAVLHCANDEKTIHQEKPESPLGKFMDTHTGIIQLGPDLIITRDESAIIIPDTHNTPDNHNVSSLSLMIKTLSIRTKDLDQ